jgi:hypothetical protein
MYRYVSSCGTVTTCIGMYYLDPDHMLCLYCVTACQFVVLVLCHCLSVCCICIVSLLSVCCTCIVLLPVSLLCLYCVTACQFVVLVLCHCCQFPFYIYIYTIKSVQSVHSLPIEILYEHKRAALQSNEKQLYSAQQIAEEENYLKRCMKGV